MAILLDMSHPFPNRPIRTATLATALLAPALLLGFLSGCASTAGPTATSAAPTQTKPAVIDPTTGEPVAGEGFAGYYGMWQVRFNTAEDAAQYASLPPEKRATVAAAQVLAAKRIPNTTCPLTGDALTAAAAPVQWDDAIVGFASVSDANQFKSLPKKKQAQIMAAWKASAKG